MSKRNRVRRSASTTAVASPPPALTMPGHDVLRRILMVLVAALVVARPLARGEDPGMVSDFSDPTGMALTLVAFVGCTGWAAWRVWAKQPAVYLGPVEILLFVVAALFVLAAFFSPYQRAAWMTAWEWLGLMLTLFLIRQLTVRPEEQRGLLAVLLAGVVALAAQGAYQAVYELPATLRATTEPPEKTVGGTGDLRRLARFRSTGTGDVDKYIRTQLALRQIQATPLELEELRQRLERQQVHGPFFHPASLAGCLALFLPALLGAFLAARRGNSPGWLVGLAGAFALLAVAALVLTRCWSAVAAVGLVGLLVLALRWPAQHGGLKVGFAMSLILAVAGGALLWWTEALSPEIERWQDVWPTTWRLIEEHGLRGVGPAQFAFFYPRYLSETAGLPQTNAGSAVLELWSEGGFLLLLAFVAGVILFFRAVLRWRRASEPPERPRKPEAQAREADPSLALRAYAPQNADPSLALRAYVPQETSVRWEYYAGGMIGIILAFLMRAFGMPPDDLMSEAIAAGVRAIVWFAAVPVFESITWSVGECVASLTAGVAAMLLVLLVNAGIGFPSVAGLLWVVIALVLAIVAPRPAEALSRHRVAFLLPLPVLVAATFCYFAFLFYPATVSAAVDRRTRYAGEYFQMELEKSPDERKLREPVAFIHQRIIEPLELAEKEDAGNVRLCIELAKWNGELAAMEPLSNRKPSALDRFREWAEQARKANPEGLDGYLVEYDVRKRVATEFIAAAARIENESRAAKKLPARERERNIRAVGQLRIRANGQFGRAAEVLKLYLPRDPTDPALHFHLAAVLYAAGRAKEGREAAEEARRLDDRVAALRKLTDRQREQVLIWLSKESTR